jgi:hypothetical protein
MTDGRFFDIVHPEAVMVLRSRAIVALRPDSSTDIPERTEQFALIHVVRTSEIPADGRQPAAEKAG